MSSDLPTLATVLQVGMAVPSAPSGSLAGLANNGVFYPGSSDVSAQNVAFAGYTLNPALTAAGIQAIGLDQATFDSIVGKHGPATNRTTSPDSAFSSTFYAPFVTDIATFSSSILVPATGTESPTVPFVEPYRRVRGQLDITTNLQQPIGTDPLNRVTSRVTIRVAPDPLLGFFGVYNVTGAFPR
jgi:hypothetical protein